MDKISVFKEYSKLYNNHIILIKDSFNPDFDINKFIFEYESTKSSTYDDFIVTYSYSLDGINFTKDVSKDIFVIENNPGLNIYIRIHINMLIDSLVPTTLNLAISVPKKDVYIELKSLKYDGVDIDLDSLDFKSIIDLIDESPLWNLYDNQYITIHRWIKQCNAVSEMYGHNCIYFKTDPTVISHTLKNNFMRDIVAIKKIKIMFPDNELPNIDNITYSDWDMPLIDEFIAHIVWNKFEVAFGENVIPSSKDIIYLPMLNKLYRVGVVQPVNSFMGKIAWWELTLIKYEIDDCVAMSNDLRDEYNNIPDFDKALDALHTGLILDVNGTTYIAREEDKSLIEEYEELMGDSRTVQQDYTLTVEEKKASTQNYTNKLVDGSSYISIKETEKLRELYNDRLNIVTINVESEPWPVNMYDCRSVSDRVIAMSYKLTDYTVNNKFKTTVENNYNLTFNLVLMGKSNTILYDIGEFMNVFVNRKNQISIKSNYITVEDPVEKIFDFVFVESELYNVEISYDLLLGQISIKVFSNNETKKIQVFNDLYIIPDAIKTPLLIGNIHLYGGKFLNGDINFSIDGNKILSDKCETIFK